MRILPAIVTLVLALPLGVAAQTPANLRIVVIEGENAVNIIQQKTAVRPLVEVRDRNNLPVAGASVTFTIGGNSAAFAGGAQTLTVTTNAAGQAAASGFSAVSSGAVRVQVQAAFQGQVATAAITQTNFATAAAAAQAGAGAGAGSAGGASGAAGGGAAGGGGISATTLAIVGGAVAGGGVLAATQLSGGDDADSVSYQGPFNGQIGILSETSISTCVFTYGLSGTLEIRLRPDGTGSASANGTMTFLSVTNTCIAGSNGGLPPATSDIPVSGGSSAINFTSSAPTQGGLEVHTMRFTGSLTGSAINGTLSYDVAPGSGAGTRRSGATSMTVTLTGR